MLAATRCEPAASLATGLPPLSPCHAGSNALLMRWHHNSRQHPARPRLTDTSQASNEITRATARASLRSGPGTHLLVARAGERLHLLAGSDERRVEPPTQS